MEVTWWGLRQRCCASHATCLSSLRGLLGAISFSMVPVLASVAIRAKAGLLHCVNHLSPHAAQDCTSVPSHSSETWAALSSTVPSLLPETSLPRTSNGGDLVCIGQVETKTGYFLNTKKNGEKKTTVISCAKVLWVDLGIYGRGNLREIDVSLSLPSSVLSLLPPLFFLFFRQNLLQNLKIIQKKNRKKSPFMV